MKWYYIVSVIAITYILLGSYIINFKIKNNNLTNRYKALEYARDIAVTDVSCYKKLSEHYKKKYEEISEKHQRNLNIEAANEIWRLKHGDERDTEIVKLRLQICSMIRREPYKIKSVVSDCKCKSTISSCKDGVTFEIKKKNSDNTNIYK